MLENFLLGLNTVMDPSVFVYAVVGVIIGQLIGVLPGIGAITAISLLLPVTFHLDATTSIIMLAGIYYGSQYGGSIASILLNLPGTPSSVVTCLDGYPMAQKGQAGKALFITATSSFVGSCIGVGIVIMAAIPMSIFALKFGAPEYASLVFLGLLAATMIATGSQIRSLAMVALGIFFGLIGSDISSGAYRFVLIPEMADGISLVSLAMGLFGLGEVIKNIGQKKRRAIDVKITLKDILPSRAEAKGLVGPLLRGGGSGSFFGALPGTGAAIASFMAYAIEKRVSKTPEKFGKGALAGLSGPEAANNAAAQTSFIPTLTLGVPGDAVMALMIGALILNGVIPGPNLMTNEPALFWGVIASFLIGNIILFAINLPLIRFWVMLIRIPYNKLYPIVILMISAGVYSHRNSVVDVIMTLMFGVLGYVLRRYRFEAAPVLLGFVLGPMLEENFRRTMLLYGGDFTVFLTRPICAVFTGLAALIIAFSIFSTVQKGKANRSV
ncbi:TctA family transporter [Pacificibacter maritimus]|uniref:TctA family transporter n=1 Tax=Pacificibacter maritimus TaxID=762213 RepID=A0A3N4TWN2_9RHOB|nr:tripartite tricarboxylate transporter permease [Pacificibacter maritimus]RPE62946.1 TctA family transporter [Pacificibacter maritimus]